MGHSDMGICKGADFLVTSGKIFNRDNLTDNSLKINKTSQLIDEQLQTIHE